MENSQTKKPNKYVALATYLIAVVCLLLGLFLPLFDGKNILVTQLPNVIKQIANKEAEFNLAYRVDFFGAGKFSVDIMAWVVMLYFVVTMLSLLALIPIGISTKRGTNSAHVFMYIVETAAVIILSVYVIIALQYQRSSQLTTPDIDIPLSRFCYNMLIGLAGPLLMLIILGFMYKKGTGFSKFLLFLLSAVGLLALFDFSSIIPKLGEFKLPSAMYSSESMRANGIGHIDILFNANYSEILSGQPDGKSKAAMVFCTIIALLIMFNYFVDVIGLSTQAKGAGYIFNLIRYGLEIIFVVCLLITVAVCKYEIGLMLVIVAIVAILQLEYSIGRYVLHRRRLKKAKIQALEADDEEQVILEHHRRPEERPARKRPARPAAEDWEQPPVRRRPPQHAAEDWEQPPVRKRPPQHAAEDWEQHPVRKRPAQPAVEDWEQPPVRQRPAREEPRQMEIMDIEPEPVLMEEHKRVEPKHSAQNVNPVYRPHTAQNVYDDDPDAEYDPHTTKPVNASQPNGTRIYTINTIYGGPVDEFMRKLTNDEKIEFAMTFIEKSKGNVGNIPEYVIGGDNKKFFSSVFIYLGRIRGMISDGLLNKMYKELNML